MPITYANFSIIYTFKHFFLKLKEMMKMVRRMGLRKDEVLTPHGVKRIPKVIREGVPQQQIKEEEE